MFLVLLYSVLPDRLNRRSTLQTWFTQATTTGDLWPSPVLNTTIAPHKHWPHLLTRTHALRWRHWVSVFLYLLAQQYGSDTDNRSRPRGNRCQMRGWCSRTLSLMTHYKCGVQVYRHIFVLTICAKSVFILQHEEVDNPLLSSVNTNSS